MIKLKQGDTGIGLELTLENEGAADLTNADVLFFMGNHTIYPTILDAVNGKILVTFDAEHTETAGKYKSESKVIFNDGKVETYPNDGYVEIYILKSIGGV